MAESVLEVSFSAFFLCRQGKLKCRVPSSAACMPACVLRPAHAADLLPRFSISVIGQDLMLEE